MAELTDAEPRERGFARLTVPAELILALFAPGEHGPYAVIENALPADVECIDCDYDGFRNRLELELASEAFEPVLFGTLSPHLPAPLLSGGPLALRPEERIEAGLEASEGEPRVWIRMKGYLKTLDLDELSELTGRLLDLALELLAAKKEGPGCAPSRE